MEREQELDEKAQGDPNVDDNDVCGAVIPIDQNRESLREELAQVKYEYDILMPTVNEMHEQLKSLQETISTLEEENHDISLNNDQLREKNRHVKDRLLGRCERHATERLASKCLSAWYSYVAQAIMRENAIIGAHSALHAITHEKWKSILWRIIVGWKMVVMDEKSMKSKAPSPGRIRISQERDQALIDIKQKEEENTALISEIKVQKTTVEKLTDEMDHLVSQVVATRASVPKYDLAKARIESENLQRKLEESEAARMVVERERDAEREKHAEQMRELVADAEVQRRSVASIKAETSGRRFDTRITKLQRQVDDLCAKSVLDDTPTGNNARKRDIDTTNSLVPVPHSTLSAFRSQPAEYCLSF